jgi:hypothetical protein
MSLLGLKRPKALKELLDALKSKSSSSPGPPGKKGKKKAQTATKSLAKAIKSKGWAPGLMGSIGSTLGSWSGFPGASMMGKKAGDWFGKITGAGAYKINRNSLVSSNGDQIPLFKSGSAGTRLHHREYITDILTTNAPTFNISAFAINPGLNATFPWLSQIASNYEQYKFHGLIFEFKSTSADALNSTNTALGTVILATEYDTYDPVFANKQQMEAYEFSTSDKPSECQIHPIECDPRQNTLSELYVRNVPSPAGTDNRFYDLGNFQIATVGSQAVANIGELWVSYDVEFFKPKIVTPVGGNDFDAHYTLAPVSGTSPWGITLQKPGSTITVTFTNTTMQINAFGTYMVLLYIQSTVPVTSTGNFTGGVGAAADLLFVGDTLSSVQAGSTTDTLMYAGVFTITSPTGVITLSAPTFTGGLQTADLFVVQISTGLT